jgi:hypothetical protein
MQKDSREVTPPLAERYRAETLEYIDRDDIVTLVAEIRWDGDKNHRSLIEGESITIGSYDDDTIVVYNNNNVLGQHVTLTLFKDHVRLATHSDVKILLDYKVGKMTILGEFNGVMTAEKDFRFSLYPGNQCEIAKRFINFHVTMTV